MIKKRVKFNTILNNQIPSYIREEFPLVSEFLKQYYLSQEFQGAPTDLIQNIDQYIKLNTISEKIDSVILNSDILFLDENIQVSSSTGTIGFPDSYGLIKIDDEIILYTSKTNTSFIGCIRGFSGISSYGTQNSSNELVFETTEASDHSSGATIINLSSLLLNEFLRKIKYQLIPGFEGRELSEDLNQYLFLKQSKDFYSTKGTDTSFKILFKSLYGEEVDIIKPQNYLIRPSDSSYRVTNDIVVESISGNPYELLNSTLFQDEYGDIPKGFAPIADVEKIYSVDGKEYYKLSFDSGYNKDINVDGSIYGSFSIHPKTKLIGDVNGGETTLDVDSTIGFPQSGELFVIYNDGTSGVILYESKNLNQFFDCSNIEKSILDTSELSLNSFAYGRSTKQNSEEIIKVRITSVLKDVNIVDDTYYQSRGDNGIIKTLGVSPNDPISNNWIFNIPVSLTVKSIILVDSISKIYKVSTFVNHNLKLGDSINIISNDGIKNNLTVVDIISDKDFNIGRNINLSLSTTYTIDRILSKVNHTLYGDLSNQIANIQNIYKNGNKTLIASSSLPFYYNQPLSASNRQVTFSGIFSGDTFQITTSKDHNFYTGDAVYYSPSDTNESLFDEGLYFIKRVDSNNIKFARSRSDIYDLKFISVNQSVEVISDRIELYEFKSKSLKSQELLREIVPPINDETKHLTSPGPIGIFNNGVEILNYKSKDVVYYGQIEEIEVVSSGYDYDVIDPPILDILDPVGFGATGYCSVSGGLQEIRIINSGFDYIETPKINITGGNGSGAKAYPTMRLVDHEASFNAEEKSAHVSVINDQIGFSTYHKFRNAEKVVYKTNKQTAIGGILADSVYYVSVQDSKTIRIHSSFNEAVTGINTISLTSFGVGNHSFKSYDKKSVVSAVNIVNSGSGYENKKRTTGISGINTSINLITIKNHGFNSGEIIRYFSNETEIGGLIQNNDYHITKIDPDNFKLSIIDTNEYVNLTSVGSGIHYFNYQPISVEIVGNIGISSVSDNQFKCEIQPVFRGEIISFHLENNGKLYGSSEILNHIKEPLIILRRGEGVELFPVINNGKIVEVLVNNSGKNYEKASDISIDGDGIGAILVPIIENGEVKSVKVVSGGINYTQNNTTVSINSSGFEAKFKCKLQTWTVNLVQKYLNTISSDDGFLFYNSYTKGNLQYGHLYAPRKLRESIYSVNSDGKISYGTADLRVENGREVSSVKHSPIIGWAYDGNPIYGPYAYSLKNAKNGTLISQMKSGYRIVESTDFNRPSIDLYPRGFFIEDFEYNTSESDTVLDEFNGRFCVTPEFPNGTYAYFATFNSEITLSSSSPFNGYKTPDFPYLIGNNFKSLPNQFNFKTSSNQSEIDLNTGTWSRNTIFYNLLDDKISYKYISLPNNLNQNIKITYSSPGSVEKIGILTAGNGYKVGDTIISDNEGSGGYGFSAKISKIRGKDISSVSVAATTLYSAEIYPEIGKKGFFNVIFDSPHDLQNQDAVVISGLSTATSSLFKDFYPINFSKNTISLTTGIGTTGFTGIVTYISVAGNISEVQENDVYLIESEKIKILNVYKSSSKLRILRNVDNSVGSSHSYSQVLYEEPRKFSINSGIYTSFDYRQNREIYFNPKESIGIGTLNVGGVGIGTTISFSNSGIGITQIFIPLKSIYLPDHNLETGDEVIYLTNQGSPIGVSKTGSDTIYLSDQSKVYISKISKDLIGISTVKVGLGSTGTFAGITSSTKLETTLYFKDHGSGVYHSFKTNFNNLTGNISKNIVTVATEEPHSLLNNDNVSININSSLSTTINIKYNDYNKKLLVNPRPFISVGVNTISNSILISNHGFQNGQKVIHTSSSSVLENNAEYYVVIVDSNIIKLANSYNNAVRSEPITIGISSSYDGTLSLVNSPINVYKNSTVIFDLSDSSLSYVKSGNQYPAFNFNLYTDSNFINLFESSGYKTNFDIDRFGTVGINSDARVILTINEYTPKKLFYKLDPIYTDNLPIIKSQISVDSSVFAYNQIDITDSLYNGIHSIVSTSSTQFTYNLQFKPELDLYNKQNSTLYYDTDSYNTTGPISKINITSNGQNYYALPSFSSIVSSGGSGALLNYSSKSIGKIKKTKINDIGFNFPSDFTLRPSVSLPKILKIEPLSSLEVIEITSVGNGYAYPPKLVVLDATTNRFASEIDLDYSFGDSYVSILRNTYGITDISPIIIPTQNSNGVGISSIIYDSNTNDVTITLSVGFSTANTFPFEVNDRVLIENVSVGLNSTGKGFNSKDYNYNLFTLTGVSKNIGGIGIVTYSMNNLLNSDEFPGIYDEINSFGKIIPEKYFPTFKCKLKKNNYYIGENVKYLNSKNIIGTVEGWNSKISYVRILSKENIKEGQILQGETSKTQGIISSVIDGECFLNFGAYSKTQNGWQTETGFLNNNLQRVQDSFYYQNFSYSLKSKVSYDTWEDAVGSLNHTLGFKKFSDYQCEPSLLEVNNNSLVVGVSTSRIDSSTNLIGIVDLNSYYDFDLARENALISDSSIFSTEVYFSSKILTDYYESVGNRVLSIDDFSESFYNLPRTTRYAVSRRFSLGDSRSQKYVTYVKDRRYIGQRQLMLVSLLHDDNNGYLNQYGRVESSYDLGSFDFKIENTEGLLLFYPNRSLWNDYDITTFTYNIKDTFVGIASTNFGGIAYFDTKTSYVSSGSTTIIGVGITFTSIKAVVQISGDNGQYELNELNLVHDGTNVEFITYGQLSNESNDFYSNSSIGVFDSYISGSQLNVDFTPNVGIAATINCIQISIANTEVSGIGTYDLQYSRIESKSTSISSTTSPTSNVIGEYPDAYNGAYFIVQISDKTNNTHQLSEVIVIDDGADSYDTEFAVIKTNSGIGTISSLKTLNSTQLIFTPNPNIDVEIKTYSNSMRNYRDDTKKLSLNDNIITNDREVYYGAAVDIKRTFDLNHQFYPIFKRTFDASNPNIINISKDTITIENHFFVTGEQVYYSSGTLSESNSPVGIKTTDFGVGIGTTDKLPNSVYIVKVDQNKIKLAKNAQNALSFVPETLDLVSVGLGTNHTFTATNQNSKAIISIDNIIQSPIISTATTSHLLSLVTISDDLLYFNSITNFFSGDLIKINEEVMRIDSVGVGSTNSVRVNRPWLGTVIENHSTNSKVIKLIGDYNIIDNKINFITAPYGKVPLGTSTNPPDEVDWEKISTNSTFYGRVFMRNAETNSLNDPYSKNYVFDDISSQFDGTENEFTLQSNLSNITLDNAVILINDIFQQQGPLSAYTLNENIGVTSITFVGSATSLASDINTSSLPSGGLIVSVGSTEGFGYQPLISAGATVTVSVAGTISNISIGNSGSGYRQKIENYFTSKSVVVRVGVATSSTETAKIQYIGTAAVTNGNIVSIAITNPGIGFTISNLPYVIIDPPLSYSNIPLVYSSSSPLGVGTQATIDIVVGQGSSVIDFEIKNIGYGYKPGDILTIETNSIAGIPTLSNSQFKPFEIYVQKTFTDKFAGWSIGQLQTLDSIERLFTGERIIFSLKYQGSLISILAAKGSNINIKDNLLVFINEILQVPGKSYIFDGGSSIRFTDPPRSGDSCKILFYKGSGDIDVPLRNILETVKNGDEILLANDASIGQRPTLRENSRIVTDIKTIDVIETNPYFGPGNTNNQGLLRPLIWSKQTSDKIINQKEVSKDRMLYEALIYPSTYIINSVGIGSTIVFVESARPFFNQINENISSLQFQKKIYLVSQDQVVSAAATAIVSSAGTITSIVISNGGAGYIQSPSITIQNPVGIASTTSTALSYINSGIVTSISITGVVTGYSMSNPPLVLIEPPTQKTESNTIISYSGDFGFITGIATTSVGVASTNIVFDFVIPENSPLRNSSITGFTSISGIQTGYYFVITESNVGKGVTSLDFSGKIVGIGTSFLDGVYQASEVSIAKTSCIGFGVTYVARVTTSVSSYNQLSGIGLSNYYGKFSWGQILLGPRQKENEYSAYTTNGYTGISTGSVLRRNDPLKYSEYLI